MPKKFTFNFFSIFLSFTQNISSDSSDKYFLEKNILRNFQKFYHRIMKPIGKVNQKPITETNRSAKNDI